MPNHGKFNMDYEETVLLKGRLSKYKKAMKAILDVTRTLLGMPAVGRAGREVQGNIEKIEEIAKKNYDE